MKEGCVCCQAAAAKANGVTATLVLLFTLADAKIAIGNVIEALCPKHGKKLDSMIYRSLAGSVTAPRKRILENIPSGNTTPPRLHVLCICGRRYWTTQDPSTWLKAKGCAKCSPKNRGNQHTRAKKPA